MTTNEWLIAAAWIGGALILLIASAVGLYMSWKDRWTCPDFVDG